MRPEDQTPLVPRGLASAPKFLENSQDKFLANEDENAYVQLEVFGDPAPKVQWLRGDTDISEVEKIKFWTDGARSLAFMGVESCTKADEGVYSCVLTNRFGRREHKFKLFVQRSFKKGPPKREVPLYWSDIPRAKFMKQGSLDQVSFTSKLTVSDQTAQWFFKEAPCWNGDKYETTQGGGAFTILIKNPSPEDAGCYRCVLDSQKELFCETYLDVQLPDPEYNFLKTLPTIHPGYVGRPLRLSCLCAEDAKVSWFKDEEEINDQDEHLSTVSSDGEHLLEIAYPVLQDSAKYSCKIIKFGKEGESETSSHVEITDFPHKFTKRLPQSISLIERENLVLQTTTQETFASVKWLKNGQELTDDTKRNQRVKCLVREGLHCLAIDRCASTDQGVYTARTNMEDTSCNVQIKEFQHRFTTSLEQRAIVLEDGRVTFELEVEDEEAEVKWLCNDIEIKAEQSRIARIQIECEGRKRCLTIKKCTSEDAGTITARTNAETTSTHFIVKCHNSFCERLAEKAECIEHCKMEFFVRVKDTTAPVYFLLDKVPIEIDDGRFQQTDFGDGHHRLIIKKVSKHDEGVLSCKTPTNREEGIVECKCIFNVTEGESPPLIGKVEPVSCVAILHSYSDRMNSYIQKEACKLVIPYKIEGTRKSNLDILVEKEGQEVQMGNDIQMKVRNDRVVIDIVNPQRTNSGIYKVTISNDQGSCEIDVPVEVLDIPSPPLSVSVQEVRKDSIVIQWESPKDDGGTPIKHFVTEILDYTTNNIWTSIAMSDAGDCTEQLLQNLMEGHKYCIRVTAANRIGQSEPRETKGEVITKDPWDVPHPCGKAEVIDWTPTFVDITWPGPTNDGGSPVTSFIIELKESSMREWLEGGVIPIEEVEFDGDIYRGRCENLQEEYEYRFRVVAVNRAGKSMPGTSSQPVKAIHKNVSPFIKGEGLQDIRIKEGKGLRFDLWVGGEPVPTIEWLRDDIRIVNDDTTSINVYTQSSSAYTLKNAVLSIPKAIDDIHGGVYKLRLKNESGVFESVANVGIDWPPEKKARKMAEQKEKEEQEQKDKEEKQKMEEAFKTFINRKLSDVKEDGKDEDKDSGFKIGEESDDVSDVYESQYADATEEDEDFYEEDTQFDEAIENSLNLKNSLQESSNGQYEHNEVIDYDSLENPETKPQNNKMERDVREKCEEEENFNNTNDNNNDIVDDSSSGVSCNSNHKSHQQNNFEDEMFQSIERVVHTKDDNDIGQACEQIPYKTNLTQTRMAMKGCENENTEETDCNTIGESCIDLNSQNKLGEDCLENGTNSTNVPNSVHLEKAEQYVSDDKTIEDDLDTCDIAEDIENLPIKKISIASDVVRSDDEYQLSTHYESLEDFGKVINIEEPPAKLFNLEEHLSNLQDQLDTKLQEAGFSRSRKLSEKKFNDGDKCLIALLDQMNREDQDFKVWEREDHCFLRWYVTKQMETLRAKVDNLKFMEAIEEDFQTYINRISDDGVPLDRAFIQAAATIFNKDIILIPTEGETDFEVIVGGISGPKDKGVPLYLGHIKKSENNSDIFISVLPDQIDSARISSILAGDLINPEITEETPEKIIPDVEEVVRQEETEMPNNKGCRQWKRMDSYNGNATKELDHIIQDILNEDKYEELNKSLYKCETESESENEISNGYHLTQDNNKTDTFPEQDPLKDYDRNASAEANNGSQDFYKPDELVGNMEGTDNNDENIEEQEGSTEVTERDLKEEVELAKDINKPHKNDDAIHQTYIDKEHYDGWTYDDETGYWIEDTEVCVELKSEDTLENNEVNLEENSDNTENQKVECEEKQIHGTIENNNTVTEQKKFEDNLDFVEQQSEDTLESNEEYLKLQIEDSIENNEVSKEQQSIENIVINEECIEHDKDEDCLVCTEKDTIQNSEDTEVGVGLKSDETIVDDEVYVEQKSEDNENNICKEPNVDDCFDDNEVCLDQNTHATDEDYVVCVEKDICQENDDNEKCIELKSEDNVAINEECVEHDTHDTNEDYVVCVEKDTCQDNEYNEECIELKSEDLIVDDEVCVEQSNADNDNKKCYEQNSEDSVGDNEVYVEQNIEDKIKDNEEHVEPMREDTIEDNEESIEIFDKAADHCSYNEETKDEDYQQQGHTIILKETEITETINNNEENEESCEGWTYDSISGYWIEDTVESEENEINLLENITNEICPLSENIQEDTKAVSIICEPLENTAQCQEFKSNDVCENFKETGKNLNEICPEEADEKLAENCKTQFQKIQSENCPQTENPEEENSTKQFEELNTDLSRLPEEMNKNTEETFQTSKNFEELDDNFQNISRRLQQLANTQLDEMKNFPSSGADSDKGIDNTEQETPSISCVTASVNEVNASQPGEDGHLKEISAETDPNPKQNVCQEKKLVKRKIKIKVSVSEQDQVKECEHVQDCAPVALPFNYSNSQDTQNTQQAISLPGIMSCVSGENSTEISEIAEGSANIIESSKRKNSNALFENNNITERENIRNIANQNASGMECNEVMIRPSEKDQNKENKMFINDKQNGDKKSGDTVTNCVNACESDPNTRVVQTADGQTVEVKMRPPLRKYSTKRTASYRWSGMEMMQIEGPPVDNSLENIDVIEHKMDDLNSTNASISYSPDANITYEKASAVLDEKLTRFGFIRSSTSEELHKDGDNCLKALIDQMSQPGQDFKVWDKSDFSFLRWYIAKQLEIHISAGKAENYVKFGIDSPQTYVSLIQKDGEFTDNDYLYSVAKLFNKDIVVIESSNPTQEVTYIKGGPDSLNGKGVPLFLGHLTKEDAGMDFYQSIVPTTDNVHTEQILSSLQETH